ncbi:hypothetical protein AB0I10_08075 [Streptomyces sp. NPDC050636]|uniref:hypothetical protein n=1 Tax=Streptomyces sp. NPDC050636 TaxID=3154510 RepID=UPI00344A3CC9
MAPPPAPPRPRTPPHAAGPQTPPRPDRAPGAQAPAQPPVAPPPPAAHPTAPAAPATPPRSGRPASFRDTAAFHLANSQALWNDGTGRGGGSTSAQQPVRKPASATPSAVPGSAPPIPAAERPPQSSWGRTPHSPQGVGYPPGMQGAPPRRPSAVRRPGARMIAVVVCLVLGIGLIGGAAAGSWLTGGSDAHPTPQAAFAKGRTVWHSTPVDTLFPRTLNGLGLGPGGADRTWTRIAVAPDGGCTEALGPQLAKALSAAGCARLLRATYVDATRTGVITVGALVTKGDSNAMLALNTRFSTKNLATRKDLMPLPYAAKGTPAADFGPAQRASWTVRVLTDIPVVVFAVSGFADGRTITDPQPAEAAARPGDTSAPGESGLGHDAKNLADLVQAIFRKAAGSPTQTTETS